MLVHIPTERAVRPVIDVAIGLALARRSHLDAVAIGYESIAAVGMVMEGGGAAVVAATNFEAERAQERANAAIAVFETEAKFAGIEYGTHALVAIPADADQAMSALSRLYDMTIVLQPEAGYAGYDNNIPQGVLFNSGGPMLMVPHTHRGTLQGRHVGIAWDGSRLAARAVRDAMPFLMGAKAVTVITVNEDVRAASSSDLVKHLSRRGIAAQVQRVTVDRGDIQSAILSIASESGIGLLAMGGFGHSRMQERILGGVTSDMFASMTVPVLMSH